MIKLTASQMVQLNKIGNQVRTQLRTPVPPLIVPITFRCTQSATMIKNLLNMLDGSFSLCDFKCNEYLGDNTVEYRNMYDSIAGDLYKLIGDVTVDLVYISTEYDLSETYYMITDMNISDYLNLLLYLSPKKGGIKDETQTQK